MGLIRAVKDFFAIIRQYEQSDFDRLTIHCLSQEREIAELNGCIEQLRKASVRAPKGRALLCCDGLAMHTKDCPARLIAEALNEQNFQ